MNQKKKKRKIDVNKRIRNYFTDWKSSYYPKLFVITFSIDNWMMIMAHCCPES